MDTIVNIEVFMQRPNQPAQLHPGQSREELPLGGIQAHHTLESRQALYQLSYHGNSAGTTTQDITAGNTTQDISPPQPIV